MFVLKISIYTYVFIRNETQLKVKNTDLTIKIGLKNPCLHGLIILKKSK